VVSIALGSFALVFSEVIPVGLFADISEHLRVSIGTGGLMAVVPAVAAAVAAPFVARCSARLERRRVLVGPSALVVVSDVIAGLVPGIGMMLAARAAQGVCVGPGSAGTAARDDRWSREKRPTNTLKSAVRGHIEAAAREELPCPTRL